MQATHIMTAKQQAQTLLGQLKLRVLNDPEALAIEECGGRSFTRENLWSESEKLAKRLMEAGVRPGSIVAFTTKRSANFVLCLLAIWKCKAVCLPIDGSSPLARKKFILCDANAAFHIEELKGELSITSELTTNTKKLPKDCAYMIYTSGSSGKPKGVLVGHGATSR